MKNVVTIGGGKGHAQVLKALKLLPEVTITAVCPSTDTGGPLVCFYESMMEVDIQET